MRKFKRSLSSKLQNLDNFVLKTLLEPVILIASFFLTLLVLFNLVGKYFDGSYELIDQYINISDKFLFFLILYGAECIVIYILTHILLKFLNQLFGDAIIMFDLTRMFIMIIVAVIFVKFHMVIAYEGLTLLGIFAFTLILWADRFRKLLLEYRVIGLIAFFALSVFTAILVLEIADDIIKYILNNDDKDMDVDNNSVDNDNKSNENDWDNIVFRALLYALPPLPLLFIIWFYRYNDTNDNLSKQRDNFYQNSLFEAQRLLSDSDIKKQRLGIEQFKELLTENAHYKHKLVSSLRLLDNEYKSTKKQPDVNQFSILQLNEIEVSTRELYQKFSSLTKNNNDIEKRMSKVSNERLESCQKIFNPLIKILHTKPRIKILLKWDIIYYIIRALIKLLPTMIRSYFQEKKVLFMLKKQRNTCNKNIKELNVIEKNLLQNQFLLQYQKNNGLNLSWLDLAETDLKGLLLPDYSILQGINFTDANLSYSVIKNVDLSYAIINTEETALLDLENILLIDANLIYSDFSSLRMHNINLTSAKLQSMVFPKKLNARKDKIILKNALYDKHTVFPDNFCNLLDKKNRARSKEARDFLYQKYGLIYESLFYKKRYDLQRHELQK